MTQQRVLFLVSILSLLGLAGCAKYKARPLNKLRTNMGQKHEHQCICFNHKAFDHADCKRYLDRDVIKEGYQPVQIEITNNTDRCLKISPASFPFPIATPESIARLVHTDTVARAVGYGVVGFFCWPFIIPAIVDGIGSAEANEALDDDFADKSLTTHVIQPYSSINGLIFVPRRDYQDDFSFTVVDAQNNQKFTLSPAKSQLKIA